MKLSVLTVLGALVVASACGPARGPGGGAGTGTGVVGGGGGSDGAVGGDAAGEPAKVVQLNEPGELVDVEASFVPGYVIVVDFWAEWCGGCKVMEARLMEAIADQPRILVRKVDVGDGETPVAEHYQIGPLPHLRIYDTHGELRYVLANNAALDAGAKAIEVLHEDGAAATP
ncbi:MAG: thioredoxin family protein [Kofleriaceae bacterium]|nr:thioredoxin family protein [Kofleriaceae bacterium]